MPHRNAGHVLRLVPLVALFHYACAPIQQFPPPSPPPYGPPAEIVLPRSNVVGNLDKIRADLAAFRLGPVHEHIRPADCQYCVVKVQIQSVGETRDIKHDVGPSNFRVIGWIRNMDKTDTESMYKLKPSTMYLVWVAPAPVNQAGNSRTRWGLLELPSGPTGPIDPVTIGYVDRCHDDHPTRSGMPDTDFKNCDYGHLRTTRGTHTATFSPASFGGEARSLYLVGRTWFDCGTYCCSGTSVNN